MKRNAIGLLGILAWLSGVLFIGAGMAGAFNVDQPVHLNLATPAAAKAPHKKTKAPQPHWGLQEFFPLPTCTNGDLGTTWRVCTPRYFV